MIEQMIQKQLVSALYQFRQVVQVLLGYEISTIFNNGRVKFV